MLLPPATSLANGEMVTVTRQGVRLSSMGGVTQVNGDAVTGAGASGTTYTGFVTEKTLTRVDTNGSPVSVTNYFAMIFTATDPGVQTDDIVASSQGMAIKAFGPSYPRGTGCWKVDGQLVR